MQALVVDDSGLSRRILRNHLTSLGFEVREAEHGQAALDLLADWKPDVALVDWNMPVLDGVGLVKALRKNWKFRSMPIVMVTALSGMDDLKAAIDGGVDEYLMKPCTYEALADKLMLVGVLPSSVA